MTRQILLRMASAAGLLALALVLVGIDPFLSSPTAAGFAPATSIDRSLKGDRLPVWHAALPDALDRKNEFGARSAATLHAQAPFGCDAAFSSISSPPPKNVYRRCMA